MDDVERVLVAQPPVGLLLGARASTDLVRTGESLATIEAMSSTPVRLAMFRSASERGAPRCISRLESAISSARIGLTPRNSSQTAFHAVSEAMYRRAQEQQAAQQDNGAAADGAGGDADASAEEDVVDAEVVDEGR